MIFDSLKSIFCIFFYIFLWITIFWKLCIYVFCLSHTRFLIFWADIFPILAMMTRMWLLKYINIGLIYNKWWVKSHFYNFIMLWSEKSICLTHLIPPCYNGVMGVHYDKPSFADHFFHTRCHLEWGLYVSASVRMQTPHQKYKITK